MSIKVSNQIEQASKKLWSEPKRANKTGEFKTSGIDNPKLWDKFLNELDQRSQFWYEMAIVQTEGSLRNVSVREATFEQYNPETGELRLFGVKGQRAKWTKEVNSKLRGEWLEELKTILELEYTTPRQLAIITLADTEQKLLKALRVPSERVDSLNQLRDQVINQERYKEEYSSVVLRDSAVAGHIASFGGEAKAILDRRWKEAKERAEQGTEGYIFPSFETGSNRAKYDAPVTRQSVSNNFKSAWKAVEEWAETAGNELAEVASEIKFGLHSLRKQLPKLMFKAGKSLEELSERLGHADATMVFNYINDSKKAVKRKVKEHKNIAMELGFRIGIERKVA
ncbi:hypothetical protein BCU74_03875 [Vibrio breoganii]|uniref:tyrosine-type recombinase/integrase n=1 Tax=Vibrio breoganii TaxID=553239 RepID=UPI000C81C9F3|nr:tyrosine-type recombinase/integrase [Vibrio breoganii]PMH22235.1 hypothetical protein BCU74_03875 [Vibrio breoganii]